MKNISLNIMINTKRENQLIYNKLAKEHKKLIKIMYRIYLVYR
jgi:hypothetical protein